MNDLNYIVKKAKSGNEQVSMDLTVLFLLEGSMSVRYHGDKIFMRHDDILLINPGMSFECSDIRDVLYGEASFSNKITSEIMEGKNLILYADSSQDSTHSYQDLRNIFYELTAEYTAGSHQTRASSDSLMLRLLDCLIEHYQVSRDALQSGEDDTDSRMTEIMQYVVAHISSDINLSELAEKMYVSTSTLSRIFKKSTGVYFTDYITKLRVQSALGLLEHSGQNLTQIAMNCGFSNSAAFNRSFKKIVGMNPSEYRILKQSEAQKVQEEKEREEASIRKELSEKGYQQKDQKSSQQIAIDAAEENRSLYENVWGKVINIGSLYELTRANMQFHALYLQEHLHIQYVRIWNIFSTKLMISDGQTLGQYNFDGIDATLDFLVQNHLKPFFDLGRRPDTAIRTEGTPVYFREEYVLFRTKENWENMIASFLSHIISRYGQDEVSDWIFELSRDPDHQGPESQLYLDPHYDFFDAWKFLLNAIHQKIPGALVGGMSVTIEHDWNFLNDFYKRCQKENCTPDFVSFLLFPYEQVTLQSQPRSRRFITEVSHFEEKQVRQIRSLMKETGLADKKLFITEWNNSISNRNFLNDGCFRSAYLVQKTEELWGQTDLLAIMAGSDWVSSYIDTTGVVNGGIGLLTKDTIRKPAFFAIQFLNQLGKYLIGRGDHYIATMQDNGDLYILCFYFSWFQRNYLMQDENIDLEKSRHIVFEDERPLKLIISVDHMKNKGDFYVKHRVLNQTSGSIIDEWGKFQYEENLTRQDVKYLQEISTPRILLERKTVGDDYRMNLELTLNPQEVSLLHIYPVG